ncbi:ester cyclase [Dehalobacter sp. DCM]|uniref:ester cyclase n=1 Tax=Dehalobacter sp. DCM TaxID=2907827 RepID=UPI0030813B60|nr:ester cyclase [Dehalobacter sp. DCM]UWG95542.1 ester cyclase [Dehalobacter sp. DCM]
MKFRNNKEIIKVLIDTVFNQHDLSIVDEIMREDYIQHNDEIPQGRAEFKRFFEQTFQSIPDFRYDTIHLVADGDIVATYNTNTGTPIGKWLGQPPTGNRFMFHVVDIFRIQDGLIAEHWDCADTYELFKQIGRI